MNIRQLAYELYKIDWMRRINADIQMDTLKVWYEEQRNCPDGMTLDEWIWEYGYDGCLYVCFDEFLGSEYQDKAYINGLLEDLKLIVEYEADLNAMNSAFKPKDIVFEDGLDVGASEDEITGYMWATDALVKRTGWKKILDDDQINFYPIYNTRTKDFRVQVSAYTNGRPTDEGLLSMSKDEEEMILKAFLTYCRLCGTENEIGEKISACTA